MLTWLVGGRDMLGLGEGKKKYNIKASLEEFNEYWSDLTSKHGFLVQY